MYVSRPKCALHAPGLFRALLVHSGLRAAALAQDRQRHPVTAHGHKRVFLRAGGPTGADRKVLPLNLVLVLIAPHAPEVERVQAWGGETTFPYGKVTRHYSPRSISANWCSFDFCLFPCRVRRLYRCICDAHLKKSPPFCPRKVFDLRHRSLLHWTRRAAHQLVAPPLHLVSWRRCLRFWR